LRRSPKLKLRGKKGLAIALLSVFLLSLALRIPGYESQPVMPDEVTYFARYAFTIIEHGWDWPVKYMYIHPPLIPYLLAIATLVAGGSLAVLRIIPILMGAVTPVFLFLLGRDLYDERVGALAALLTAFSSYHILYSRAVMLEAPLLFFLTGGLYFYVRSSRDPDRYQASVLVSGVFLGLAIITKWVALLYIPAFLLYLVLRDRSPWALIDRRTLTVFLVSGLVALPCVLDLLGHGVNPLYRNLGIGTPDVVQLVGFEEIGLPDLAVRGVVNFLEVTVHSDSRAAGMIPWSPVLGWVAGAVFALTMAYSAFHWIRGREQESLLFSLFLAFNLFVAIYGKRFQYYLIWSLPIYSLLASASLTGILRGLSPGEMAGKVGSVACLAIGYVFVLSIIAVGLLAPGYNGGPTYGFDEQVMAMKTDLSDGDIIAATFPEVVIYYMEEFDLEPFERNILVVPLNRKMLSPIGFIEELDMQVVSRLRPRFLLTNRYYFDELAGSDEVRTINQDYRLVSEAGEVMLFERARAG